MPFCSVDSIYSWVVVTCYDKSWYISSNNLKSHYVCRDMSLLNDRSISILAWLVHVWLAHLQISQWFNIMLLPPLNPRHASPVGRCSFCIVCVVRVHLRSTLLKSWVSIFLELLCITVFTWQRFHACRLSSNHRSACYRCLSFSYPSSATQPLSLCFLCFSWSLHLTSWSDRATASACLSSSVRSIVFKSIAMYVKPPASTALP